MRVGFSWHFALAYASLIGVVHALQVDFSPDFESYSVSHTGVTLFKAENGIAVFLDGAWHTQSLGSLILKQATEVSGSEYGLGRYRGVHLSWLAGSKETPFVTTTKTFDSGFDVSFEYSFPLGANGTSIVEHHGNSTRDEVNTNFPAFSSVLLPDALSWSGSFVQSVPHFSKGPNGGPTVFFNRSDPILSTVVVASAMNNFKASSAGPGTTWNGKGNAWVPGTAGTIRSLEPGFTQRFILHMGTSGGITAAVTEWGQVLQRVHRTYKLPDVTLAKVGYQTDNGATYTFCNGNCSQVLLDKMKELKKLDIPMGYLSFQGNGASMAELSDSMPRLEGVESGAIAVDDAQQAAPWCIERWSPDLENGTSSYPMSLKRFQHALGIPLQLYAPYFCPSSEYFSRNNASSPWISVVSDTSLEGCDDFDFQDISPRQSRQFYEWFFDKGKDAGMVSFESDFMNQNYNCVPEFIESSTAATMFLRGMADAALCSNLAIQWCYATPTDVLASLDMPAVTNFRVSFDFCYGASWNIGASSLLVWALGAAPSKDTLWTTDNNRTVVPGCSWTPDHEDPAAELHVVLALMSMGPVGISDKIGSTNAELVKRIVSADGTLLRPTKSLTSVDSLLAGSASAPDGNVYGTYSQVGDVVVHQFVSFQLKRDFQVASTDFFPPLSAGATAFVYRTSGTACENGTKASSCIEKVIFSNSAVLVLPKSDFSNTTGGTDFKPNVTTVWPVCQTSGWTLLGELSKYVPVSAQRFASVLCTDIGIGFTVKGSPREKAMVTLLKPTSPEVLVVDIRISNSGEKSLICSGICCS